MSTRLSAQKRTAIVKAVQAGMSTSAVAEKYGVTPPTVKYWATRAEAKMTPEIESETSEQRVTRSSNTSFVDEQCPAWARREIAQLKSLVADLYIAQARR